MIVRYQFNSKSGLIKSKRAGLFQIIHYFLKKKNI